MKAKMFPVFILSFLLVVAGCKKDDPVKPDLPTPSDSTLAVTLNGVKVSGIYAVQFEAENLIILKWNYSGKVITVLKDGVFFSNKTVGDTTMKLENSMTFTFRDANGKELPPKIGISIKTEIILPQIISFTASSYSILRGDSVVLSLIYSNGDTNLITSSPLVLKSLSTDSVRSLTDFPVFSTRYTAVVWNQYGSDTATVDVVVTEPTPPTNMDYISAHPWTMESCLYKYYEGDPWIIGGIIAGEKNVFHSSNTWEIFSASNILIGNGTFFINETILDWGGNVYKIIELNDTIMTIKHKVVCYSGCPTDSVITQTTYRPF